MPRMANSARFAEGMRRVINGEVNLDEFLLLHGDSRASPTGAGSSSRASAPRDFSKSSPSGVIYGNSKASSSSVPSDGALHGDSSGASSSRVSPPSAGLSSYAAPS